VTFTFTFKGGINNLMNECLDE